MEAYPHTFWENLKNGRAWSQTNKSAVYQQPGNAFITFVRGWIGFVGVMALANTVQCYVKPDFVAERLYNAPDSGVTLLTARTYGMWTLLAAVVRFTYAVNVYNWELFLVTVASFLIAFLHFLSELLLYQTGLHDIGMYSPIIVSGISMVLMLYAATYIWPRGTLDEEERIDMKNLAGKIKKPTKRKE